MSKRFPCIVGVGTIVAIAVMAVLARDERRPMAALAPLVAAPAVARAAEAPIDVPAPSTSRGAKRPDLDRRHPRFLPGEKECALGGWIEIAEGVPAADAAVAVLDESGATLGESSCAPNGVFYVAVANASGPRRLLALAPGFEPKVVSVDLEPGRAIEVEPIQLERGAAIEGRVSSGRTPLARVEIQARTSDCSRAITCGRHRVVARDDGFAWAYASVETRADGTYTIGGLSREPHRVEISALRGRDNALDTSRVLGREVATPSTAVDFDLPSARLELEFLCAGAPVAGVEVQLDAAGRQFTRLTDEDGRLVLRVTPALAYPLIASRGGYATKRAQARGLMQDEERSDSIELEPLDVAPSTARWIVEVAGSGGGDDALFRFRPLDDDGAKQREVYRRVRREPTGETFVLEDLPEGRWSVAISSGAQISYTFGSSTVPYFGRSNCDAEIEVAIPASGIVRSSVRASPSATFEIEVRDRDGVLVPASIDVRDSSGMPIPLSLRALSGRVSTPEPATLEATDASGTPVAISLRTGGGRAAIYSPARLDASEITLVTANACAGVLDVRVSHPGFESAFDAVIAEPGKMERLSIVLRRE